MNYNPFIVLLGQVIRHLLTLAAGALSAYGVTADQQTALVSSTTAVAVSILVFVIGQGWAYVSKDKAYGTPTS